MGGGFYFLAKSSKNFYAVALRADLILFGYFAMLSMIKYCRFTLDSYSICVSVIAIEVIAVEVLYL